MLEPLGILCFPNVLSKICTGVKDLSFSTKGYMLGHDISTHVSVLHTSVSERKCVQEAKVKGTKASQDFLQGVRRNEDTKPERERKHVMPSLFEKIE